MKRDPWKPGTVAPAAITRRGWLRRAVATALAASAGNVFAGWEQPAADDPQWIARKRESVRRFLYSRSQLDDWLAGKAFLFTKYDPELGYLHAPSGFRDGVDGSIAYYQYDPSGARRMIAHANKPCRINSYGDSFTHCDQVNDGESWQEVLAAHLGEPVRNFGISGYSVYQAYLRMKREERRSPAEFIIFNIYDGDHYRSLHSWPRLLGTNPIQAKPPTPFVKADPDAGEFVERPTLCPRGEDLYAFCDLDSAYSKVADDVALNWSVTHEWRKAHGAKDVPQFAFDDPDYTRRAIFASTRIVDKIEEFAARDKRRVMYVLSYSVESVRRRLNAVPRFDRAFVEFLVKRRLPYVDLLEAHAADYARCAPGVEAYLARHFIGHYTPLGNFFCAFALKDKLVRMLAPPPPSYAPNKS